ncbi:MAG: DNA polymerase/3'-5' exonuclease PolX [Candidatus Krumholzibacteriia bacterium]
MSASEVAGVLQQISALLELTGANPFKVRAYENASRVLPGLGEELAALVERGDLRRVRGIGSGIAEKVAQLARTGRLEYYEELRARVPEGLLEMLRIPGLGPKKIKLLYDELDIATVEALEQACRDDRLEALRGFGAKTQENILGGIAHLKRVSARFFWSVAFEHASPVLESLRQLRAVRRAELAGSLRRRRETVHDVDIVASTSEPATVTQHFVAGPWADRVIGSGPTKTSILHPSGLQIDLRVVSETQFPYALHHFTGSKEHNVAMRGRAQRMGIKINEYGLFHGDELIECADEGQIFSALGLAYVPPELREDQGEIEAAENDALPRALVELDDLRGAFHVHTRYSDGTGSITQMVEAARELGWKYIGVSDHSRNATKTRGMSLERVLEQLDEIERVARKARGIRVFRGVESEILPDGSLDYPDDVLRRFDFVIASVHDGFDLGRDEQTRRVLRALENPFTTILGHPTGRILFGTRGLELDLPAILGCAARHGVVVEINGQPKRMDLDGPGAKLARDKGALLSIGPDAHDVASLVNVRYGVGLARRGWLEPRHVLNTWKLEKVVRYLQERRQRAEVSPA